MNEDSGRPALGSNASSRPKRALAHKQQQYQIFRTLSSHPFVHPFTLPCIVFHTALTNDAALTSARCQFPRCGCAAPPLPNQIVVSWDRQLSKLGGVVIKPGQPFQFILSSILDKVTPCPSAGSSTHFAIEKAKAHCRHSTCIIVLLI